MKIPGPRSIPQPFITGFEFVAAQMGASEYQLSTITQRPGRLIRDSNRDIGQLLAYPYHDRRGGTGPTLSEVYALWRRWQSDPTTRKFQDSDELDMQGFRLLIDPWLQHDHGETAQDG